MVLYKSKWVILGIVAAFAGVQVESSFAQQVAIQDTERTMLAQASQEQEDALSQENANYTSRVHQINAQRDHQVANINKTIAALNTKKNVVTANAEHEKHLASTRHQSNQQKIHQAYLEQESQIAAKVATANTGGKAHIAMDSSGGMKISEAHGFRAELSKDAKFETTNNGNLKVTSADLALHHDELGVHKHGQKLKLDDDGVLHSGV